jgi:CID domain
MDPFSRGLDDLGTVADRAKITGLAMCAEDALGSKPAVEYIANVLYTKLATVEANRKLPILYVLDYIVKSLGIEFQQAFSPNLVSSVLDAFPSLSQAEQNKCRSMVNVWMQQGIFVNEAMQLSMQLGGVQMMGPPPPVGPMFMPPISNPYMIPSQVPYPMQQMQMVMTPHGPQMIFQTPFPPVPQTVPQSFSMPQQHQQPLPYQLEASTGENPGPVLALQPMIISSQVSSAEISPYASHSLYESLRFKCPTCGKRFDSADELQKDSDFHKLEKKGKEFAKTNGIISSQHYYIDEPSWVSITTQQVLKQRIDKYYTRGSLVYDYAEDGEADGETQKGKKRGRTASMEEPGPNKPEGIRAPTDSTSLTEPATSKQFSFSDLPSSPLSDAEAESKFFVIATGAKAKCVVCGEPFEREFDEDSEEWVFRGAVSIQNELYHVSCATSLKLKGKDTNTHD